MATSGRTSSVNDRSCRYAMSAPIATAVTPATSNRCANQNPAVNGARATHTKLEAPMNAKPTATIAGRTEPLTHDRRRWRTESAKHTASERTATTTDEAAASRGAGRSDGRTRRPTASPTRIATWANTHGFQRRDTQRPNEERGAIRGATTTLAHGNATIADDIVAAFGPYSTPGVVNPCTNGSTDTDIANAATIPSSAVSCDQATTRTTPEATQHSDAAISTTTKSTVGLDHSGRVPPASAAPSCKPTTAVHVATHIANHGRLIRSLVPRSMARSSAATDHFCTGCRHSFL